MVWWLPKQGPKLFFSFCLVSEFSPMDPVCSPSKDPPSKYPVDRLFLTTEETSSPPIYKYSETSFIPFKDAATAEGPPSSTLRNT